MRVLINSWRDLPHPQAGGSEVVVDQLATSLSRRGHDVVLRAGGPLGTHDYAVVAGGGTYSQYLRAPFERHHYRSADVVVDVNNGMAYYSPYFSQGPVMAMVHHIHTHQWPMFFGPLLSRLGSAQERFIMPRAYRHSLIMSTSPSTSNALLGFGVHPDRIRQLPINASLEPVATSRHEEPLFVACGRLTAHKRYDLLLELWERVRPHIGGRLVIIGDGPEREALQARAGTGVDIMGRVAAEEKARLFGEAWALVHTAPWEGWGLVITEAGLAATPSLGFDVRGVRDAIIDGQTGWLATTDNDFIEKWIALANDQARRTALGEAARNYAAHISSTDSGTAFETILNETIEIHRARRRRRSLVSFPRGTPLDPQPEPRPSDTAPDRACHLSIVVPAYNEAERLPVLLEALTETIDTDNAEIIVVDDGSEDDTEQVAKTHLAAFDRASIVSLPRNQGKGAALRAGVAAARGRRITFMDADLATDLTDLGALLKALDTAQVAIGSRTDPSSEVHNGAPHRRFMAKAFSRLVRATTSVETQDSQCGFKAFRGPVARLLFHLSEVDGFAQDVEILDLAGKLGFCIAEVPVRWTAVPGSKVDPVRHSTRMAYDVVRHRVRPINAAVLSGISLPSMDRESAIVAKETASVLRATDPVLDDGASVHVLLPGVDRCALPPLVDRIASRVGCSTMSQWSLDARSLLRLTGTDIGEALRSIGEPIG